MRDQDVCRVAAGDARGTSKLPGPRAEIFLAAKAGRAILAANPRKCSTALPEPDPFCIRSQRDNLALDFVPHRVRQSETERQFASIAEIEISIMNVHVAVAH